MAHSLTRAVTAASEACTRAVVGRKPSLVMRFGEADLGNVEEGSGAGGADIGREAIQQHCHLPILCKDTIASDW